jgi:ferritin-like metal-binding protein YciE
MDVKTLKDLFVFRLNATHSYLTKSRNLFTELSGDAQNPKVKDLLQMHSDVLGTQISHIEQCFKYVGTSPTPVENHIVRGIIEEVGEFRRWNPTVEAFDAFRVGTILRIGLLKLADYRILVAESKALGLNDCTTILEGDLRDMESKASTIVDTLQQYDQQWSSGGGRGPSMGMR